MHGLYSWLRRHPWPVDGLLALSLLALGLGPGWWRVWPGGLWYVALIAGMMVPVVFRRRYPVAAFCVVIAVGAIQVLTMKRPIGTDLSVLVVLYTLAATQPRRIALRGLAVVLAGSLVAAVRWQPQHPKLSDLGLGAGILSGLALVAWLLGDSARWRRGYYQELEEKTRQLERERDALAQVAAASERARIARELHDVVAHHVSVMVVQADGAAFALDSAPEKAREAVGVISKTGRQALAEMRRLLGVLRSAQAERAGPAELGPMPGLGDLEELAAQTRAAGLPVGVRVDGTPRPLPGGADLAAYRVVQESLTNVRKHGGPGAAADVSLRYSADGLEIQVTDDGRGASAISGRGADGGHGLDGMRERAALYGGEVTAGPLTGGGYQVRVVLPYAHERVAA